MRDDVSSRRSFLHRVVTATLAGTVLPRCLAFAQDGRTPAGSTPEAGHARWAIGVCAGSDRAGALRAGGASYLEIGVAALLPDRSDAEFDKQRELLASCALPIRAANGFLPGSLKSVGPDANHEGILRYAQTAFRRGRTLGIETIVFGSSGSRTIPDGFERARAEEQMRALLGRMGPLAEMHGITVAIEPLNKGETNFINTLLEGAAIVTAVGHPNIRLMADLYHVLVMDEPPESIARTAPLLRHVHIAEEEGRRPPGHGTEDFVPYFRALQQASEVHRVSIECRWDDVATELPKAVATLHRQMDAACERPAPSVPEHAILLFDGSGFARWRPMAGDEVRWTCSDGAMTIAPGTGSILTRDSFQDFRLHVEFNVPPAPPGAEHQARSNSGVYLQRRYEVQILDSYGLDAGSGDCGALYRQRAPDRNACKPPDEWQSYDIVFRAPRFERKDGASVKVKNARITVRQNDVVIHDDVELTAKTGAGEAEGPDPGPILLQDHGAAVRFRNVWIVPLNPSEDTER